MGDWGGGGGNMVNICIRPQQACSPRPSSPIVHSLAVRPATISAIHVHFAAPCPLPTPLFCSSVFSRWCGLLPHMPIYAGTQARAGPEMDPMLPSKVLRVGLGQKMGQRSANRGHARAPHDRSRGAGWVKGAGRAQCLCPGTVLTVHCCMVQNAGGVKSGKPIPHFQSPRGLLNLR